MSDINAIIASIGDAIVLANKQSKEELKAYIKSELGTYKFSGTQIRQNSLPGAAIGRWGVPYTKVSGLQAEVARIAVAEISTATIDYAQISNVRIKTADIDDAAITTAKIGDAAITSAKIGDAEIGTAKIANAAIKTANIDLGAITTALIQEGAVGSVQIADGSITDAKIVELTANKITAGELAVERLIISGTDKSIVYAINNMGDLESTSVDTLDGDTLTPRTITADKIVAGSITSGEISAEAIITNKIAANAVTADKIAANAITANSIDAGAVTADKIDAGAVTTEKLDARSVTAEKIAVGAIVAEHLDAENIFAENANIQDLIAENLDVETFFAREGVVNKITLDYVQPLNDAITVLSGNLSDTNADIDQIISANATKQYEIDTHINNLNLALSSLSTGVGENNTSTQGAINAIQSMIATLEAQRSALSDKVASLEQAKIKTDNYIQIGTVKLSNGTTVFGVAVGKDVDVLNPDGTISTFERSMTATTANEFMILTGGAVVGVFDATGMTSESVKVNKIVMGNRFAWSMTASNAMVLKKGG